MSDTEWTPVKWRHGSRDPGDPYAVYIEVRTQRDGSDLFVVACLGNVLNREGDFEYEPIPSSRDDAFIARTRFATFDEATAAFARRLHLLDVLTS